MNDEKPFQTKAARIDATLSEAFELVAQLAEAGTKTRGRKGRLCMPTGFHSIDQHIDGLWPGELTVVTGAPGVGKSSFASNLSVSAAKQGARVLFVSLGAPTTSTVIRMCAAEGRMRARDLLTGHLSQDDWSSMADASNRLSKLDLFICDDPFLSLEGLFALSQGLAADAGKLLVVIDGIEYLRVSGEDRIIDWPYTAGTAAVFLKSLARAINSPVLVTFNYGPSQRREIHSHEDVFAVLPPGAESAADSILHIDRCLAKGERNDFPSNIFARITIAKSRVCAPTEDRLAFIPEWARFMDYVGDHRTAD